MCLSYQACPLIVQSLDNLGDVTSDDLALRSEEGKAPVISWLLKKSILIN